MGFIPPDKGLEVLEIGGINKLYDELQIDIRQAQRENLRLQQPAQMAQPVIDPQTQQPMPMPPAVPVNTWDNHAIHIDTHNKFRKTQKFEVLDDQIKAQFEAHIQMHQGVMAQSMQPQMPPGMPGQPPDPNAAPPIQQPQPGGPPNG
jgi:hypothetical protein